MRIENIDVMPMNKEIETICSSPIQNDLCDLYTPFQNEYIEKGIYFVGHLYRSMIDSLSAFFHLPRAYVYI